MRIEHAGVRRAQIMHVDPEDLLRVVVIVDLEARLGRAIRREQQQESPVLWQGRGFRGQAHENALRVQWRRERGESEQGTELEHLISRERHDQCYRRRAGYRRSARSVNRGPGTARR